MNANTNNGTTDTVNNDTIANSDVGSGLDSITTSDATQVVNLNGSEVVNKVKTKKVKTDKKVVKSVATRGPGRPTLDIALIMNRSFTLKELQEKNPGVKAITLRAHVLRGLASGKFVKLPKNVETGLKGKPAHRFLNSKVFTANQKNLAAKKNKVVESELVGA